MNALHRSFEAGDYEAAIERSRALRRVCRGRPAELGWVVYYEFRSLYALGRTRKAWDLLHSDDRRESVIDRTNDGWMCSVGSELAAKLGRIDDVLRLGERCLTLRRELGDPQNEVMCCQTVCTLLHGLGRPDRHREFAQHLVTLGVRHRAASVVLSGIDRLLDSYEHTAAPEVVDALREAQPALATIADPARERVLARCQRLLPDVAPTSSHRLPSKDGDTLDERLFVREIAGRNKRDAVTVRGLSRLSLLVQHGFEHVGYDSHVREDGCLFWITDAHAAAIGRCLAPSLRMLHLSLTTFAGDGFDVMTAAAPDGIALERLVVHHRSGDEVTVSEARGLARLVTKLGVRQLSLWALEYETDALDTLASELERLDNRTLSAIDVCDLHEAEPADRIDVPALAGLLARNRAA